MTDVIEPGDVLPVVLDMFKWFEDRGDLITVDNSILLIEESSDD